MQITIVITDANVNAAQIGITNVDFAGPIEELRQRIADQLMQVEQNADTGDGSSTSNTKLTSVTVTG